MKYLLDTHVLLWTLFEPSRLSKKVKDLVLDDENEIYVSIVSLWEISMKYGIGKLNLENIQPEELPIYINKSGFEILHLDDTVASSFHKLPRLTHFDPFDRMLIWQSIHSQMTIVSKDKQFNEYTSFGLKLFWK
ncbi:MAG: type II toxin-antitoxin system VapC family toxin [Leptospiraceae bacterium]|nr:type II toxin-antitoxin system VapC family toxin [Leptospiraceae bacterium]MCP5512579.1 type II toxin-antitoxin system VapC family toxin [Leptospiraceae bacterium]